MFAFVNTGAFIVIMLTLVISYTVSQNALAGAQGGWFPELFTAARRASGASLAYQTSAMVSGFTPFVTTLLFGPSAGGVRRCCSARYALIGLWAAFDHQGDLGTHRTAPRRRGCGARRFQKRRRADVHRHHAHDHRQGKGTTSDHRPPPPRTRPRPVKRRASTTVRSLRLPHAPRRVTWVRNRVRAMSGRPSAPPTCSPPSTPTGSATAPTIPMGRPGPVPAVHRPLRHRPLRRPRRGSDRAAQGASHLRLRRLPTPDVRHGHATPPAWKSPAAPSATDYRRRRDRPRTAPPRLRPPGSTTSFPTAS